MRATDGGPATEYSHPDYVGKIGLIEPYSPKFCDHCNAYVLVVKVKCIFACLIAKITTFVLIRHKVTPRGSFKLYKP